MNQQTESNAYLRLIEIGIALSQNQNIDSLLEHILLEAKSMANADAGSIYLNTDNDTLEFTIVLNDTLRIAQGGISGEEITLPEIQLSDEKGKANLANIASCVSHRGETVVIDDSRTNQEFDFSGTRKMDEMLGYETISFLTIPLKTVTNKKIGVLQLLNAKDESDKVVAFSEQIVPLIEALSSQASVAIENRTLLDEQEELKTQLVKEVDITTEQLKEALTKLSEAHISLKELNTMDAVTGIRNRSYFDDVLDQEWRRARRQGYDISLMILDIDFFKKVNDTYGHLAGDECLAGVASEVDDMFNRPSDVVARYGGEEFVVVLPYVSNDNAMGLAEQLRKKIESKTFMADGNELKITMSIGLATADPSANEEVEPRDLIGWADGVLYEAKSSGRNRVCQHKTNG